MSAVAVDFFLDVLTDIGVNVLVDVLVDIIRPLLTSIDVGMLVDMNVNVSSGVLTAFGFVISDRSEGLRCLAAFACRPMAALG